MSKGKNMFNPPMLLACSTNPSHLKKVIVYPINHGNMRGHDASTTLLKNMGRMMVFVDMMAI